MNSQNRGAERHDRYKVGQIFNMTKSKIKEAARSACLPSLPLPTSGIDSYADPGGGEPPPTPTSPVADSAYSEHHGCWPCEHRDHSDCEASSHAHHSLHSQPSSGRSSPRWDEDDDEDHHHILTQGPAPPDPIPSSERSLRLRCTSLAE